MLEVYQMLELELLDRSRGPWTYPSGFALSTVKEVSVALYSFVIKPTLSLGRKYSIVSVSTTADFY
jgi:hypothetical protein